MIDYFPLGVTVGTAFCNRKEELKYLKCNLDKIKAEHYYGYIQKVAIKQWNKKLTDSTIARILNLTECHPYYVNLLCS